MVNYEYFDLFWEENTDKQAKIEYSGGVMTNEELMQGSEELTESICSKGELKFGSCESSVFKFKVANIVKPLVGERVKFSISVGGHDENALAVGTYRVESDKLLSDRMHREVVAYDELHWVMNASAISWYNEILPEPGSKVTLREFRESFFRHFGLEEELPAIGEDEAGNPIRGLANDGMVVEKTVQVGEGTETSGSEGQVSILKESALSGLDVITAICEINGCFGRIGRNGKFQYVYLKQDIGGLYPKPGLFPHSAPEHLAQSKTGNLYPQGPSSTEIAAGLRIECKWEDYFTKRITKLQIRQDKNDIGKIWPEGEVGENDNLYIIEGNFLVYGKTDAELGIIAENIFRKITDIVYMPFEAKCVGNPCLEAGDAVRLPTKYAIVESYILKRTMSGVQALRDDYSAEGTEKYSEKANGVQSSIIQLKGKTNTLERNVERTVSKIEDVERETATKFEQTADAIEAEASARDELGKEIKASFVVKVTEDGKNGVVSEINGTADKIHFGANNMFTVSSPNFSINEDGDVFIAGKNGISLSYKDTRAKPPTVHRYVFAKTGYEESSSGGFQNEPFLNIYSPNGTLCISIGANTYTEKPDMFETRDTPYFPNGAAIKGAWIESIKTTYAERLGQIDQGDYADSGILYSIRKSGAFVSVYGDYKPANHDNREEKEIQIVSTLENFLPTHHAVRTVGYARGRLFVFRLSTDGVLNILNTGESIAYNGNPPDVRFRFDYFLFQ